jgi:hypothetical protein
VTARSGRREHLGSVSGTCRVAAKAEFAAPPNQVRTRLPERQQHAESIVNPCSPCAIHAAGVGRARSERLIATGGDHRAPPRHGAPSAIARHEAMRRAPSSSLNPYLPISAAKRMLVSRKADTGPIGP